MAAGDPVSELFENLDHIFRSCERCYERQELTENEFDFLYRRLEFYVNLLDEMSSQNPGSLNLAQLVRESRPWLEWMQNLPVIPSICCSTPANLSVQLRRNQLPGRPSFDISYETLEYLKSLNFTWTQIAKMYGVSRNTVTRRVTEFGLQRSRTYNTATDADLRTEISNIHNQYPHAGCRMVRALLCEHNVHVTLHRVHQTLTEIDPFLSATRWGALVRRRIYSVRGANSLWHIDGNHSLVRWGFVVHGGIDGYSRMVVYLVCNTNNSKEAAFRAFHTAVDDFGLPSRVRGDRGGENVDICQFMIEQRGTNRGSFIAGPSTANQRIERLWRDVFHVVLQTFYAFFYWLEDSGYLQIGNDCDIFALHYIFRPRINGALKHFAEGWNIHPVRTEQNWTPQQIWVNSRMLLGDDIHDVILSESSYGQDWQGPVAPEETSVVELEDVRNPLSEADFGHLCQLIPNVEIDTDDFGLALYLQCKDFVAQNVM